MAIYRAYRCPDCGGVFDHLHHPNDSDPPDRCLLCKAWMLVDEAPPAPVFMPRAPRIRKSAKVKGVDATYRAMEQQSAARAEDAVAQLEAAYVQGQRADPHQGDPRILAEFQKSQIADMRSSIKITDMKDPESMRDGDTSHIAPAIPQGQVKVIQGGLPGNFGMAPQIDGYTRGTGMAPELGAVMGGVRANHAATMSNVIKAGNLGVAKR